MLQAVLLCEVQELVGAVVAVKVAREAAFRAREADEVDRPARPRIDVPVFLERRIALQAEAFPDAVSLARIIDQQRKRARVYGQFGLDHGMIVGHTVLTFIPVLGWIILPFFSLAIFVIAVIAAIKAFQNQKWQIPVIGPLAETQANQ